MSYNDAMIAFGATGQPLLDSQFYALFHAYLANRFAFEIAPAVLIAVTYITLATFRPTAIQNIREHFRRLSQRRTLCILICAFLPITIRLATLPWTPVPYPKIHDEFVHLLVADTLLEGRLANPQHPVRDHLDTIYVLHQPTYSAIYPIGQGLILAVGHLLTGHYWGGVLLAVALMCGSLAWVLFGLLPSPWAFIGGLIGSTFFGVGTYWTESYYGGAFLAFAGTISFGAYLRLLPRFNLGHAFLLTIGLTLCFLIRPYESSWYALFLLTYTCIRFLRKRDTIRETIHILATFVVAALITLSLTVIHNISVTGHWHTLPYNLSQRQLGVPPGMLFQTIPPPTTFPTKHLRDVHEWQVSERQKTIQNPWVTILNRTYRFWHHYMRIWLVIPLFVGLFACNGPLTRFAIASLISVILSNTLYFFFFPHYIAMCVVSIVLIATFGIRWAFRHLDRPAVLVPALGLFVLTGTLLSGLRPLLMPVLFGQPSMYYPMSRREHVENTLNSTPGKHVVLVSYGLSHNFHDEWVYNRANIDTSHIVWANYRGDQGFRELLRYFPDRKFWLCEVNNQIANLIPLQFREMANTSLSGNPPHSSPLKE